MLSLKPYFANEILKQINCNLQTIAIKMIVYVHACTKHLSISIIAELKLKLLSITVIVINIR